MTAPGEAAEVRTIVRRLLREAARGVPLEEMGVVLPRPESYAPLFADLLARLGVPHRLHPSLPLRFGRAARSLLLLFSCRGLERPAVMEFLTFKALDLVTPERIEAAVRLAHQTMRAAGKAAPRIGVAALNPHGGENGLFGDEEITIIRPTLEKPRAEGLPTEGPLPSDTVFIKARDGAFDAVVMMYHDEGQIATMLLRFHRGVTVTAGMPTVFTTPAHGTAYDIVGQGKANPGALESAFDIAVRLAAARRH